MTPHLTGLRLLEKEFRMAAVLRLLANVILPLHAVNGT